MKTNIQPGASLRLVQSPDASESIPNGVGGVPQRPSVEKFNNLLDAFGPNGEFPAPQAGKYRFNTSAELNLPGGGFFNVAIEDTNRSEQSFGRGQSGVPAKCCVTLKLNEGDVVRRLLSLYDATADATVYARPDANFYEIEYLGL